ncbi:MAG TPA: shikimate dehydrogenase [Marmoricola sp.]|nr:shikimate dehydrogenase [Marmoricola sp.]
MTRSGQRCAVLGKPIAHSLSPALHRAAYDVLGLDWSYEAIEVDEAGLAPFLAGLDESWRGLSLTMPLKRTLMGLLQQADEVDRWARLAGAANTLVLGPRRRVANTDVPGAVAALRAVGPVDSAVVLGGGATAGSVLLALAELGCSSATVLARSPARAAEAVATVGRHPAGMRVEVAELGAGGGTDADLLVSTLPGAAQAPDVLARFDGVRAVFDVAYDPWPTPLAAAAAGSGRTVVTGLDLLVEQAVLQVAVMTGATDVPVGAMREAGERELAARRARGLWSSGTSDTAIP